MESVFPWGFPLPTAFYLTAYVASLMLHVVFMNYVLAGSAYVLGRTAFGGRNASPNPLEAALRDWLPFMLSAAITAGIAPLLFLQILYRQQFYTANLLLFYRWMAILPVLIAGFYLTYVLKSRRIRDWPRAARVGVGLATFACFGFVGWSWVENHLLSVHPHVWTEHYASDAVFYVSTEAWPRFGLWFVAAFPTMALMVAWQLWWAHRNDADRADSPLVVGARSSAFLALPAIALGVVFCYAYFTQMSTETQETVFGSLAMPYVILAAAGAATETFAWAALLRRNRLTLGWLIVGTVGLVARFAGMAVVNEATRLAALDMSALYPRHATAWKVGGMPAFVVFFVVNLALMYYCVRLTKNRLPDPAPK